MTRVSCTSPEIDHILFQLQYQIVFFPVFPSGQSNEVIAQAMSVVLFSSVSGETGRCLLNLAQKKGRFEMKPPARLTGELNAPL